MSKSLGNVHDLVTIQGSGAVSSGFILQGFHSNFGASNSIMKPIGIREDGKSFQFPHHLVEFSPVVYESETLGGVLRYLNPKDDGNLGLGELCVVNCHFCKNRLFDGGTFITDGEFVWPYSLLHYVKFHGFPLPDEFWVKMKAKKYICPSIQLSSLRPICEELIALLLQMDEE